MTDYIRRCACDTDPIGMERCSECDADVYLYVLFEREANTNSTVDDRERRLQFFCPCCPPNRMENASRRPKHTPKAKRERQMQATLEHIERFGMLPVNRDADRRVAEMIAELPTPKSRKKGRNR